MKQNLARQSGWKCIVSTVVLVLMICARLGAQAPAAGITISADSIPISRALKEVARQLKTGVSYDADLLKDRPVSLHLTNVPYAEALKKILAGTGLEGFITKEGALSLRRSGSSPAKPGRSGPVTLTGHVEELASNTPLASVTITVRGTRIVALTDGDGAFTIGVPDENAVLVISYTGYEKKEVRVGEQTTMNISLRRENTT